jgi:hypothetical protein
MNLRKYVFGLLIMGNASLVSMQKVTKLFTTKKYGNVFNAAYKMHCLKNTHWIAKETSRRISESQGVRFGEALFEEQNQERRKTLKRQLRGIEQARNNICNKIKSGQLTDNGSGTWQEQGSLEKLNHAFENVCRELCSCYAHKAQNQSPLLKRNLFYTFRIEELILLLDTCNTCQHYKSIKKE